MPHRGRAPEIYVEEREDTDLGFLSPSTQNASSICLLRWRVFFPSEPCILRMGSGMPLRLETVLDLGSYIC